VALDPDDDQLMSAATLTQVVRQISGDHVTGFFLVLARIAPLFILAPMFSSKMLPVRVRGIIAVALAIGLTPMAVHGQHIPSQPLAIAGLVIAGLVVGLAFAFAVGAVFAAIQAAGSLTDTTSGFSYGSIVDPVNGNQGGAMTSLYSIVGLALFITIGGDAWLLRGIARTFAVVPLTHGPRIGSLVTGAETMFGSIFLAAIEVAAPVLLALVITDVAFGMVSRVVPQMNVFAVGFPVKIGVALLVVSASLPFLGSWMSGQLETAVATALQSLRIA
jgi:flagellar biosynthetic protein FliR